MKYLKILAECLFVVLFASTIGICSGLIDWKIGSEWHIPFVVGFFCWPLFQPIGQKINKRLAVILEKS